MTLYEQIKKSVLDVTISEWSQYFDDPQYAYNLSLEFDEPEEAYRSL